MGKKVLKQFNETVKFLKKQYKHTPQVGIVLGSGLGNFINEIDIEKEVAYKIFLISPYQLYKAIPAN